MSAEQRPAGPPLPPRRDVAPRREGEPFEPLREGMLLHGLVRDAKARFLATPTHPGSGEPYFPDDAIKDTLAATQRPPVEIFSTIINETIFTPGKLEDGFGDLSGAVTRKRSWEQVITALSTEIITAEMFHPDNYTDAAEFDALVVEDNRRLDIVAARTRSY